MNCFHEIADNEVDIEEILAGDVGLLDSIVETVPAD